jgi:hypothetical protein
VTVQPDLLVVDLQSTVFGLRLLVAGPHAVKWAMNMLLAVRQTGDGGATFGSVILDLQKAAATFAWVYYFTPACIRFIPRESSVTPAIIDASCARCARLNSHAA